MFIHGGYWQAVPEEFACLIEGPRAIGWSAALPGYTLAPDLSLTGIVAEIHAALDWLAAHGPANGIAGPIVLSGWSAGGHLTAMALGHPAVRAGLAISGLFELGPIRDTYLNEKLRLTDAEIAALSPLRLPVSPKPLAIAYGTAELPPLVSDSRELHARRAAAHAPGPLLPVAGADHFTIVLELQKPDGQLTRMLPLLLGQERRSKPKRSGMSGRNAAPLHLARLRERSDHAASRVRARAACPHRFASQTDLSRKRAR